MWIVSFLSFYETHEQELPKCEGEQREIGVNLCRFGLCLAGALYQVAVASLGGLWPAVPTNHIPAPTTPAWTHSNPPVWCQTPAHTHTHTHTSAHAKTLSGLGGVISGRVGFFHNQVVPRLSWKWANSSQRGSQRSIRPEEEYEASQEKTKQVLVYRT